MRLNIFTILMLVTSCVCLQAQAQRENRYDVSFDQLSPTEAIDSLVRLSGVKIAYSSRFFSKKKSCKVKLRQARLERILEQILIGSGLIFTREGNRIVLFKDRAKEKRSTIFGHVKDQSSGEHLAYSLVYCASLQLGTTANEYGYFSLELPHGTYELSFRYLGMKEKKQWVTLAEDQKITVGLASENFLAEVLVDSDQASTGILGSIPLRQPDIQQFVLNAPGLGGEQDLMQTVRSLAGVQSGGGGVGGYYVRGGSQGHNLILMDGVTVYNPGHMLGLYSIFNPSATRDLKVFKSSFSARYGGRLSSVIDVYIKEGNQKEWKGEVGISPQSALLTLEGPMPDKKGSILIAARHSTFGNLVRNIVEESFFPDDGETSVYSRYYDFNIKLNRILSPKDRLYWSFYQGGDRLGGMNDFEEEFFFEEVDNQLQWGNVLSSLRWNHAFSPKLFANTTLSFSSYNSSSLQYYETAEFDEDEDDFFGEFFYSEFGSQNDELALKSDFDFLPNDRHQIRAGLALRSYTFNPLAAIYDEDTPVLSFDDDESSDLDFDSLDLDFFSGFTESPEIGAFQTDIYLEDLMKVGRNLQFSMGLRHSLFVSEGNVFSSLEPRLGLSYEMERGWTSTLSLSRMSQFLHLVANSELNFPHDVWIPASENYEPETTLQADFGLSKDLADGSKLSANIYYKLMNRLVMLPDSIPTQILGEGLEDELLVGSSKNYGLELSWYKNSGKLQYLFNYTLSSAQRQFDGINFNETYPFQFDRRHEGKAILTYQLKPNLLLGVKAYVGSGHPRLLASGYSSIAGIIPINRNDPGMLDRSNWQHRLDLSLAYHLKQKQLEHRFKLEAYNIYSRTNPLFFYRDDFDRELRASFSIPFVPSFHYTLSF